MSPSPSDDPRIERLAMALFAEAYMPGPKRDRIVRHDWPQVSEGLRWAHRKKARELIAAMDREEGE